MKKLTKLFLKKRNQEGFSLIELMIVVVIIGLLATMAVPQYRNFQMKAKQSEAKANLGGLYTGMQTFFAEYNAYYGDFRAIGFSMDGPLNYNVGFNASHVPGPATHPSPTYKSKAAVQFNAKTHCGAGKGQNPNCKALSGTFQTITGTSIKNGATANFKAGAAANLDGDTTLDVWTIDQTKAFTHVTDDISL